jgi:hypothetical protein
MKKEKTCCELCMTFHEKKSVLLVVIGKELRRICLQCMHSVTEAYRRGRYAHKGP